MFETQYLFIPSDRVKEALRTRAKKTGEIALLNTLFQLVTGQTSGPLIIKFESGAVFSLDFLPTGYRVLTERSLLRRSTVEAYIKFAIGQFLDIDMSGTAVIHIPELVRTMNIPVYDDRILLEPILLNNYEKFNYQNR